MNTRTLLASSLIALASMAATSAFADSYDREYSQVANTPSTVTRAQVKAELLAAQKDGSLLAVDSIDYPVIKSTGTPKTRAQVRSELIQAEKDGSIPVYHG